MSLLAMVVGLSIVVCGGVVLFSMLIGFNWKGDMGGSSVFECGFEALGESRVGLSMRFFILVSLFLIFDVEVVLLLPLVLNEWFTGWFYIGFLVIFVVLLGGLGYEWFEGSLSWVS